MVTNEQAAAYEALYPRVQKLLEKICRAKDPEETLRLLERFTYGLLGSQDGGDDDNEA